MLLAAPQSPKVLSEVFSQNISSISKSTFAPRACAKVLFSSTKNTLASPAFSLGFICARAAVNVMNHDDVRPSKGEDLRRQGRAIPAEAAPRVERVLLAWNGERGAAMHAEKLGHSPVRLRHHEDSVAGQPIVSTRTTGKYARSLSRSPTSDV